MSKNARKYQKPQTSKHNARCAQTPKKVRYRDHEEATDSLFSYKRKAKHELADFGSTTFKQNRVYECSGCKGFHITSQKRGQERYEVVRAPELTISELILSA
jgi:spore maturation protein CgeB